MRSKEHLQVLWLYRGSFIPLLAVLVGFAVLKFLDWLLGHSKLPVVYFDVLPGLPVNLELGDIYSIAAIGLWWMLSVYLFWIVAIISIVLCWFIVHRALEDYSVRGKITGFFILAVTMLIVSISLLQFVLNNGTLVSAQDLIIYINCIADGAKNLAELTNGLAIVAIIVVFVTSSLVLVPARDLTAVNRQIKYLNIVLYTGAILLLAWVLYARILYGFAATLIVADQQKLIDQIAPTLSLVVGAVASIFLILMYLTGFLWLQARHAALCASYAAKTEASHVNKDRISPKKILLNTWPRIFAFIVPALPGILESFFGFGNWF